MSEVSEGAPEEDPLFREMLVTFYAKHDPDKRGDAQKTAKKFARKAAKLMHALREKYDDVPELAPEGAEEEARRPKKARKGDSGGSGGHGREFGAPEAEGPAGWPLRRWRHRSSGP